MLKPQNSIRPKCIKLTFQFPGLFRIRGTSGVPAANRELCAWPCGCRVDPVNSQESSGLYPGAVMANCTSN